MGETRRRWPWLPIVAGGVVMLLAGHYGRRAWLMDAYLSGTWRPFSAWPSHGHQLREAGQDLNDGHVAAAGRLLANIGGLPSKGAVDQDVLHVMLARLRVQTGGGTEDELWFFVNPSFDEATWYQALEQIVGLRRSMNDVPGAVRLLEAAADGAHRHPALDRLPFPAHESWAAELLVETLMKSGDGPGAYRWALRYKYDYACPIEAPCGMGYTSAVMGIDRLVGEAAQLAGVEFTPEPDRSWHRWWAYGPGWFEILPALGAGAALVLGGIWGLQGGPLRRLFWARRGVVVRSVLAALFAAGAAPQIWLLVVDGLPPPLENSIWMLLLSPFFALPAIALFGAFLAGSAANPARPSPGPPGRRTFRGGPVRAARRPPWRKGPRKRTAGWILSIAPRRPANGTA